MSRHFTDRVGLDHTIIYKDSIFQQQAFGVTVARKTFHSDRPWLLVGGHLSLLGGTQRH